MDDGSKKKKLLLGKMAERKVVIMYKDVWKRFGAKILIVMCSILLLGGVAIAAPRLQAADTIDLDTIDPAVDIKIVDANDQETVIRYTGQPVYPEYLKIKGEVYQKDEDYLVTTLVKDDNTEYNYTDAGDGDVKIKIEAYSDKLEGDCEFEYRIYPARIREDELSFTVTNTGYEFDATQNPDSHVLVIPDTPTEVSRIPWCGFQVYVPGNPNPVTGYSILNQSDENEFKPSSLNEALPFRFKMNNYEYVDSTGATHQEFARTVRTVHHITSFSITLNNIDIASWTGQGLTSDSNMPTVVVNGQTGNYTSSIDTTNGQTRIKIRGNTSGCYGVTWSRPYTVTPQKTSFRLVKTVDDAGNPLSEANYLVPSRFKVPYDEDKQTYLITEMAREANSSIRSQYQVQRQEGNSYVNVPWNNIDFDSATGQTEKTNATAGRVTQNIKLRSGNVEGEFWYSVVRNITSTGVAGGANDGVSEKLQIGAPVGYTSNGDEMTPPYEYDGNRAYRLFPQMYFQVGDNTDKDSCYVLQKDIDYTVSYSLKDDEGNVTPIDDGAVSINAGTVIMTVTGIGAYDGTITGEELRGGAKRANLTYKIERKKISNTRYTVELDQRKNDGIYAYSLGTTPDTIIKDAYLRGIADQSDTIDLSGTASNQGMQRGRDYKVRFYRYTGSGNAKDPLDINDGDSFVAGNRYAVEFEFIGNYEQPDGEDKLSCDFKVEAYDWSELQGKVVRRCDTALCTSGDAIHYYNGQKHEPEVILTDSDGDPLPDGAYTLDYGTESDNINAGKGKVIVHLAGDPTPHPIEFDIQPRILKQEDVGFTRNDGFQSSGSSWTHEYGGKTGIPDLTALAVSYNIGDESISDTLLKGNNGFTVEPGHLYVKNGSSYRDVTGDSIDAKTDYYYRVTLTNPNYQSDVNTADKTVMYVGPFRYTARDLSGTKETQNNREIEYSNGYENYTPEQLRTLVDTYLRGSKDGNANFVLRDFEDTDLLQYLTDYKIAEHDGTTTPKITNDIKINGTIRFTLAGIGCYTGEKIDITIDVGQPVTGAIIRERVGTSGAGNTPETTFDQTTGIATLSNRYNDSGLTGANDDRYGISFLQDGGPDGSYTYLYYGEGNSANLSSILYLEKQYIVDNTRYEKVTEDGKTWYIISIRGINGYYGEGKLKFVVEPISIKDCKIEVVNDISNPYIFIWKDEPVPVKLKVTVTRGAQNVELEEGVDYDIFYTRSPALDHSLPPTYAGVQSFWLQGKNGYGGTRTGDDCTYEIQPRSIPVETVSGGAIVDVDTTRFKVVHPVESKRYMYLKDGVEPKIQIEYSYIGKDGEKQVMLTTPDDFEFRALANKKVTLHNQPKEEHARIEIVGKGNFTGTAFDLFTIDRATMSNDASQSDCFILLNPSIYDFQGRDIRPSREGTTQDTKQLTVGQYITKDTNTPDSTNEGKTWVTIDPDEYNVEFSGNYYVSGGSTGNNENEVTKVTVTAKQDDGHSYSGSMEQTFTIRGDLAETVADPVNASDWISKTEINSHVIPYSTIRSDDRDTSGMEVEFIQKERDGSVPADQPAGHTSNTVSRILRWKKDYKVYIDEDDLESPQTVKEPGVYGRDDNKTYITGIAPNFKGTRYTEIVIQGNLSSKDETQVAMLQTGNPEIIVEIPDGKPAPELQNVIKVTCDGKTLTYGTDYVFDTADHSGVPDLTAGIHRDVVIVPAPGAGIQGEGYLTGECPIEYKVQQEIKSDSYRVEGVVRGQSFEYNHGSPVLALEDIKVYLKDAKDPLRQGRDYTINFRDDGIKVGNQEVIITPTGNYGGEPYSIPFTIVKFDLKQAYDKENVDITAAPDTIYTGENVFPEVRSVVVYATSGSSIANRRVKIYGRGDSDPDKKEEAFELRPVEGQDNINYQDKTMVKCILAGIGNYTGEIELEYCILQKNIEDMTEDKFDIRFYTELQNYPYQNGDSIEPEPRGEYNGLTLVGRKDTGGGSSSFGRDVPFIYTYPKDTKNVGTKTITITGNGNFTGVRTLDYNITQLDLADTELKFADTELVYDRQEQRPSFTLSYGGKQIVTYDKVNGVKSDYINNVKVKFDNAVDATRTGHMASVTLSFDPDDQANSNYKGTKTAQFAIQPASLEGHVVFMYHPEGEAGNIELKSNLHLPWTGESVKPVFPIQEPTFKDTDLAEGEAGAIYEFAGKRNSGDFLKRAANADATVGNGDYTIDFKYVEPDSEDVDVRDDYGDADGRKNCTLAGKVRVTITGINNYKDSASFWYYIGDDISADGSAKLQTNTAIYNAKKQPPTVIVSGISRDKYTVARYRGEVKNENFITEKDIIDAATYYIRLEGNPTKGTYATKPITLTYTIQPRAISNSVVIDGFKKEYNYTGLAICPVGISVTDYIDRTKYKLTENEDYSLTYTNNINVGTATINVNGEGNFKGTAAARFAITSSMISGGSNGTPGGSVSNGSGQISGAVAVAPDDVRVTLDAGNAMYYTGKQLTPAVTISGMTQNTDYTVTYSNNIEVGTGVITITGMGNNTGTITKNFRIVAKLSDCKVTNIPDQQYTGSAVEPLITVTCGNSILTKDKDYTVSFVNNVEVGTATAMIRAAGNSNYIGSLEAKFNIGNNVGGFIVSGYAPTYPYTGSAITPAVTVESGSTRLQQGTDYTVSYENNVDAGSASIIVKGAGKYTGTQTVNFIIEPRSIQVCETTEVEDKTYTGDAYTPSITVRDSGKVLQNGVDYTLTYSDNVNPGLATITIQGLSNNYTGTKKITFRIGGVAVSGLQVSAVNATSIKLKWQQQGYADGYQVCNSKSKVIKTVNGGNASTTVAGLKPGKTYKYKVRSYTTNSQGERSYSAASAVVTATTKLKTPAVTLKRNGTGRMRIKWTKSTNADGYEIFYKNTKSAKYRRIKKVDDVNTRICNVRGIKSGKKCYVRVRAYKKTGSTTLRSAMSKTKTIKVK